MARKAREKSQSGIYHVVISGESKQDIFLCSEDKEKFLSLLVEYQDVCGFKLYAYALLGDHMHLMLNECDCGLARIMTRIGTSYVYWFNNKYERSGTLFPDRFKSEVVDSEEDFKRVLLYIHKQSQDFVSHSLYFTNKIIVSDMARRIFGGVIEFEEFHKQKPQACLDIKVKLKSITDNELETVFQKEFGFSATELIKKSAEKIAQVLAAVFKTYSVPLRQLARLTKISTTKLWRYTSKEELA